MIVEQTTFIAFTELYFAGFTRVTDAPTNEEDRSEVYDVDSSVQKPVLGHLKSGRSRLGSTEQVLEILSPGFVAKSRPMQPQSTWRGPRPFGGTFLRSDCVRQESSAAWNTKQLLFGPLLGDHAGIGPEVLTEVPTFKAPQFG